MDYLVQSAESVGFLTVRVLLRLTRYANDAGILSLVQERNLENFLLHLAGQFDIFPIILNDLKKGVLFRNLTKIRHVFLAALRLALRKAGIDADDEVDPADAALMDALPVVREEQRLEDLRFLASLEPSARPTIEPEDRRFVDLAFKIYHASLKRSERGQLAVLGIDEKNVICKLFENDKNHDNGCPNFIFFHDPVAKKLVLAVRGTYDTGDVITDICCESVEYLGGKAHEGIARKADMILAQLKLPKLTFGAFPDVTGIVVTGHSLGAGVSVLVALNLLKRGSELGLPAHLDVKCIALAPPPVFEAAVEPLDDHVRNSVHIFINRNDIVPRLGLDSVSKFLATLKTASDNLPKGDTVDGRENAVISWVLAAFSHWMSVGKVVDKWNSIKAALFPGGGDCDADSFIEIKQSNLLGHHGLINYLYQMNDRYFVAQLEDGTEFSHKFKPEGVKDHGQENYAKALYEIMGTD